MVEHPKCARCGLTLVQGHVCPRSKPHAGIGVAEVQAFNAEAARVMTNRPSVPSLDDEACVRLLTEIAGDIVNRAKYVEGEYRPSETRDSTVAQYLADAALLLALASALGGIGNDREDAARYRWIRDNAECGLRPQAKEGTNALWSFWLPFVHSEMDDWLSPAIDADRAAQPEVRP